MSSNSAHQREQPDELSNITRHGASWKEATGPEDTNLGGIYARLSATCLGGGTGPKSLTQPVAFVINRVEL